MKKRLRLILSLVAALILALDGGLYLLDHLSAGRTLTEDTAVHFIDVGQGDATLLLSGRQAVLVDAGTPESADALVGYLHGLGIERLYAAVATHPHADHIGGMAQVLDAFPVEHFYMGPETASTAVYAAMLDKDEQAETFFKEQSKVIEELKDFENTEQTVAFFYVSTDGTVVVRKSEDYIPKMIEIAGGRYVFDDLENTENNSASISISMEEFFASAADADYLIYNSSIDNPVESMEDLLAKSELFADFKAVQDGNVWCTGKYLYQATDIVGNLITDIHLMLTDGKTEEMTFLYKVS